MEEMMTNLRLFPPTHIEKDSNYWKKCLIRINVQLIWLVFIFSEYLSTFQIKNPKNANIIHGSHPLRTINLDFLQTWTHHLREIQTIIHYFIEYNYISQHCESKTIKRPTCLMYCIQTKPLTHTFRKLELIKWEKLVHNIN